MSNVRTLKLRSFAIDKNPSILLHTLGYFVFLSAVLGINSAIREPGFSFIAAAMAGVGNIVSLLLRRVGRSLRLVELLSLAACIIIAVKMLMSDHIDLWIAPTVIAVDPELRLAALLLWIEVLRSFTLVNDDAVVFSAVPAATLFSLAANVNINPDIMAYFLLYVTCTCFLLVHKSAISSGQSFHKRHIPEQLRSATVIALFAIIAGAIVAVPLRAVATKAIRVVLPEIASARNRYQGMLGSDAGSMRIAQGPVDLSEETVMLVKIETDHRAALLRDWYWRGRVYDEYTGHGWRRTGIRRPRSAYSGDAYGAVDPDEVKDITGKSLMVTQTVQVLLPWERTVYSAAEPVKLISPPDVEYYRDSFGALRTIEPLGEYKILSRVPDADEMELLRAGTNYPHYIERRYLQRDVASIKTAELAKDVAGKFSTPFAKAKALERYLSTHYTYDTNAAPAPRTVDAVEYFLFTSRSGYCDVFSSAMVVMCRELGVPARLATGFASGIYDPEVGAFRVRDADRHAWAEVYFPGHGWIAFDPVAPRGQPKEGFFQEMRRNIRQLWRAMLGNPVTPVALLLLITVLLFATAGYGKIDDRFKLRLGRRKARSARIDPHRLALLRKYNSMCREIRRAALPERGNLAPGEYRDLLFAELQADSIAARTIDQITQEFEEVRYGGRNPDRHGQSFSLAQRRVFRKALQEAKKSK